MNRDDYNAWLAAWTPRPVNSRAYRPALMSPWTCPRCHIPASLGVRWGGLVSVRCEDHGTWYAQMPFRLTDQELTTEPPRGTTMSPEARLWFLHTAALLMQSAPEGAFVVAEVHGGRCDYAILDHASGYELALQVNGREWDCPTHGNEPLTHAARLALSGLGFAAPGPQLNPWREDLPDDARDLAVLMERSLVAAYDQPLDFEVALYAGRPDDSLALMDALMPSLEAM